MRQTFRRKDLLSLISREERLHLKLVEIIPLGLVRIATYEANMRVTSNTNTVYRSFYIAHLVTLSRQ